MTWHSRRVYCWLPEDACSLSVCEEWPEPVNKRRRLVNWLNWVLCNSGTYICSFTGVDWLTSYQYSSSFRYFRSGELLPVITLTYCMVKSYEVVTFSCISSRKFVNRKRVYIWHYKFFKVYSFSLVLWQAALMKNATRKVLNAWMVKYQHSKIFMETLPLIPVTELGPWGPMEAPVLSLCYKLAFCAQLVKTKMQNLWVMMVDCEHLQNLKIHSFWWLWYWYSLYCDITVKCHHISMKFCTLK